MAKSKTATKAQTPTKRKSTRASAKTTGRKSATQKSPTAKKSPAKKSASDDSLTKLDETGLRSEDRRKDAAPVQEDRRKVQRRRQIDPTTCERDYNLDEIEFMHALDHYKRTSGRMFPTCSEILEVLQKLGYRKLDPAQLAEESSELSDDQAAKLDSEENEEAELEEFAL